MKKTALFVALAVMALPHTGAGARSEVAMCPTGVALEADTALPVTIAGAAGCTLTGTVVTFNGVALTAPEPGVSVEYSGEGSLALHHGRNGELELAVPGTAHSADPGGLTPGPGCATSTAYTLTGGKWYSDYQWRYNPTGEPLLPTTSAFNAISAGVATIVNGANDCGETRVPATAHAAYVGATTAKPNIGLTADTCGVRDGISTVGWGNITTIALARTCVWRANDRTPLRHVEADVVFDTGTSWYANSTACVTTTGVDYFDLHGVAAHEFGHVYGLDHVSESGASASLTMSSSITQCSTAERTLGRGDLNGLFALYGAL